jgi:hypothetical protein
MIQTISVNSSHIYGSISDSGAPYVSPNDSIPMMGMVRYINQRFEVYNGGSWLPMSGGYVNISMNGASSEALDWAVNKMSQEKRIIELAKENPTVADAYDAVKHAQEQLDIILTLTE